TAEADRRLHDREAESEGRHRRGDEAAEALLVTRENYVPPCAPSSLAALALPADGVPQVPRPRRSVAATEGSRFIERQSPPTRRRARSRCARRSRSRSGSRGP